MLHSPKKMVNFMVEKKKNNNSAPWSNDRISIGIVVNVKRPDLQDFAASSIETTIQSLKRSGVIVELE